MHFRAALVGLSRDLQRLHGYAIVELHEVRLAVAPDAKLQPLGKRIHHRDADTVQTPGDLVRVLVELAPGVQLGHHDLGGGALEIVVVLDVGRYAAAVVDHRDRVVGMDHDLDVVAMPGKGFVDRVVHDFEDHVVKARAIGGIADVHPGALAHGVQALEDLDAGGVVVVGRAAAVAAEFGKRCH